MKKKLLIAAAVLAVFGCVIAKAQFGFGGAGGGITLDVWRVK